MPIERNNLTNFDVISLYFIIVNPKFGEFIENQSSFPGFRKPMSAFSTGWSACLEYKIYRENIKKTQLILRPFSRGLESNQHA
jgi:hypothetical protein